jgi:predicted RNase H-like HicB family nuclease
MPISFNGFAVRVFYDEPDNDWVAHFEEMPNVSAFADTPVDALKALEIVWGMMIECYEENDQSIPKPTQVYKANSPV